MEVVYVDHLTLEEVEASYETNFDDLDDFEFEAEEIIPIAEIFEELSLS